MIFFGKGHVWDKQNSCMLCSFKNGKYETEDSREIKILQEIGFKSEYGDEIIVEAVDIDELDELKAQAKELGLKGYGNIKDPDKLREFIAERVD